MGAAGSGGTSTTDGGVDVPCDCPVAEECSADGSCVPISVLDECMLDEDCEIDELCEPSLGVCIPRDPADVCEFRPPVGEFEPVHPARPGRCLRVQASRRRVRADDRMSVDASRGTDGCDC
ncbi:MAG: hypothetical protein JRF42_10890 [Deltaproteobacteria bacterium]|nr:hypothetical protein [Deltaproteobacteria bacterium]